MSRPKKDKPRQAKRAGAAPADPVPATRVLIHAPTGNDARLTANFLTEAGFTSRICRDVPELFEQVGQGCGALLLAEETLADPSVPVLVRALAQQPAWSDLPIIVITSGGETSQTRLRLAPLGSGGNVTLLERPFRPSTLLSTVEAALRARKRQYEVHDLMAALRESEKKLRSLHESSHDCIQEIDLQGRLLSLNQNGQALMEIDDFSKLHLTSWLGWWHGADRKAARHALAEAKAGRVARFQGRCATLKGREKWWDVIVSPLTESGGSPQRLLAISRDITASRDQQNALMRMTAKIEEQARVFNTTLSHINDFAYIFDRAGRFLYANQPLLTLLGLDPEQIVGKNFFDLRYPDDLAGKLQRQIQQVIDTKAPVRDETPFTSETGAGGFYEYIFSPVLSANGSVQLVAGSTRVITERKLHELQLAQLVQQKEAQAQLFDTTLSSLTDLAYTFDLEGNWIYANQPLLKLWGKTLPEITGKSSLELGYPVALAERLKAQVKQVVATRQPVKGETYFTDAAGVEDYHEYIFSPVLAPDGTVTAVCGTTRLTTQRKKSEAMADSQRRVMQLIAEDARIEISLAALMRWVELAAPTKIYASVYLLDPDGIHLRRAAAPSLPAAYSQAMDGMAIGPAAASCGTAAFLKKAVYVSDIAKDPRWADHKDLALKHGLRACWSIPILSPRGNLLGTFAIYHPNPRVANDEDLRMAEMATRTASIAIERKLNDASVRESERRYSQLVHSLPAAVYTTDANGQVTLYNEAAVALWGRQPEIGKDFWCGSYRIFRPDGSPLPLDQCPMAVTLREGRAVRGEEIIIERPDGTRRNVVPYPDPIRDAAGNVVGAVNMLLDITESKRAEEASRRLAAIVESSDDAIISKDLNSIITSWNIGAQRLFGYEAHEIIGQPVTTLMPPERWNEEPGILKRIRNGESIDHYETIRRCKDGRLIEVSLTISPLKDARGKIIGASKILRDITQQKQAERELEQAHARAVAASRAKDNFLAALSHELRTPLNPVLLLASEAAEDPQLAPAVRAQFATIRNNVELEARLIDDLLDLTRITHGKLSLDLGLVDLHGLLKEVHATVRPDLAKKQIAFTMDLSAERSTVKGDAVRLQQVLWNVLKNAVKFTPDGGTVAVRTSTNKGDLVISVEDSGIGLTAEERAHIFEAFAQGEHGKSGGSHQFGGLGLGLAISRKLVEVHAGSISASSAGRGQGATFTLTLPLAAESVPATKPDAGIAPAPAPANGKSRPVHVLLVEDHEPTRTALAHLLTRRGYTVKTAASLAAARELSAHQKFELLVSDIGLPDGSGLQLMKELRAHNQDLRGIALTGYGQKEDLDQSREAGFASHLTKPVRVQSLEAALATVTSG